MRGLIVIFPCRVSSAQRVLMVDARLLKSLDGVSSKTSVADVTDGDISRSRCKSQTFRSLAVRDDSLKSGSCATRYAQIVAFGQAVVCENNRGF